MQGFFDKIFLSLIQKSEADYEKINNAVDNDTNCWVINGNRICGAYTFEDDKTKIEVTEDGKTHITIK